MHFSNINISTISYWISVKFSSNVSKHLKKRSEEKYLNILTFLKKFSCFCYFFEIFEHPDIKKIHGEQVAIKIKKTLCLGTLYGLSAISIKNLKKIDKKMAEIFMFEN